MNHPSAGKEASAYGRRGQVAAHALSKYRIEGEFVTIAEIAQRAGLTAKRASYRMAELRNASGPITWARLSA